MPFSFIYLSPTIIYIYIYICVYTHLYIYVYTSVNIHTCICVYAHIYIDTCVYTCVYVCMKQIQIHMYKYIYIYIYTHVLCMCVHREWHARVWASFESLQDRLQRAQADQMRPAGLRRDRQMRAPSKEDSMSHNPCLGITYRGYIGSFLEGYQASHTEF